MKEESNQSLAYSAQEAERYKNTEKAPQPVDAHIERVLHSLGVENSRLLDYGCGNGRQIPLLMMLKPREIVGCDSSAPMIEEARKRQTEDPRFKTSTPLHLDLLESPPRLPYPDRSFDIATATFVLHYLHDLEGALKEISRVLRLGGRFVAVFSDFDFKPGREHLKNTEVPLRIGAAGVVRTLATSGPDIVNIARNTGFVIEKYERLPDATIATIDTSYPHRDDVVLNTGFLVARKNS